MALYNKTIKNQHVEYGWINAKKTKQADSPNLELQRFFSLYCTQGLLELSKLIKILKECKNLMDKKKFTVNIIDLQFSKIKSKNESKINYKRFIELLSNFGAIKFLDIDPVVLGVYTGMDVFSMSFILSWLIFVPFLVVLI